MTDGPRIALVGAGSAVFTRKLLADILTYPELRAARLALHDIDVSRLELARLVAERLAASVGATPRIEATPHLGDALAGADVVINTIQVGGLEATAADFATTAHHGVKLTIGDTIGVAGVFRGLRTIPVVLNLARQMEERCPDAWLLNYTNPMSMVVLALARASSVPVVGLCHSVARTVERIGAYVGVPAGEIDFLSAGINHIAFLLRLEHRGQDLYPRLRAVAAAGGIPDDDLVRAELFRRLGFYPTESSEHHAEYSPYFLPHPEVVERLRIPIGEYLRRSQRRAAEIEDLGRQLDDGLALRVERSDEHAAPIIHARLTNQPAAIVGNVSNAARLIANLPTDAAVEVPCFVDRRGVHSVPVGSLPRQLAAMMRSAVDQQALTVDAALDQDREAVYHAAMLDPLLQAQLDLDRIWRLTDDMIEAGRRWLPAWLARERPAALGV